MSNLSNRIKELEAQLARESEAREKLELALHHSDARFRSMARNLTEMVLAYDMERCLTFVNPAAFTLTGYGPSDFEQNQFICWVHPEDRDRMLGYWDRLFEGHSYHEEEYRLVTRDGRVKWMAASWGPILDEGGRQVGVQGREREVTHRHMAEETLRIREERYRSLFEESPFPMWEEDFSRVKLFLEELTASGVVDVGAHLRANRADAEECVRRIRVIGVNRAAREFYGATREQLMGDLTRIFDDAGYEVICDELAELTRNNSTYRTEFETKTSRGDVRTVTMIVSLEPSPGDWSRVIVSFFDITDHKRLEEQMLQSQKLESLGRLAGGIAHDFNNLLMVILGYSDLLLADKALAQSAIRGLREIRNAGERGAELTQQLLAFSRKQIGQPRVLHMNELIRESFGMLQRVIGEDIELVVRLEADAWTVRADRGQMHQVLINLVINGREAMPSGGVLTIETSNLVEAGGEFLRLTVRDTGVGMDDVTRRHVFEPFFTTKNSSKGTGLGLSTVFGVVTQAGGHLTVSSEPGNGSAFNLYLPRHQAQPGSESVRQAPLCPTNPGGTVLLVEDQPDVRRLADVILTSMGFDVLQAEDGFQALALAQSHAGPIGMMLTDVIMPGMNGRELAERLRQSRPETRVLFMSGYTDRIMSPDGILDPSVAYLQKPFTADQLSAAVISVLE
jgi:two-component system, cell cycle sensor histidine kinase and response regulator CckA